MPACAGMDGTRRRCVSQRRGLQGPTAPAPGQRSRATMSVPDLRGDTAARRARKRPLAVPVEFADSGGTLETREGPVRYKAGDALLTGAEGERWPVPRAEFDESYEALPPTRPGKPGGYRKRPRVVWAKPRNEPFVVPLDGDRGSLSGKPGDWLVQYAPDNWSVVSGAVFADTYELLD